MRYVESENPYIIGRFTSGDTVTISIYDLSDNSTVVNAASMSEVNTSGYFKYQFNPSPSSLTEYLYIMTNGIEEHAGKIILGGYPDSIIEDTNELQSNQGNWSTATGFATQNPPSQTLDDYKADISTLETDVAFIKDIEGGKWELTGTQMIFYKDDNITEVARFDITKDLDGNPIQRDRV